MSSSNINVVNVFNVSSHTYLQIFWAWLIFKLHLLMDFLQIATNLIITALNIQMTTLLQNDHARLAKNIDDINLAN